MKLYRGLKHSHTHLDESTQAHILNLWSKLLRLRQRKNFAYPKDSNREILELRELNRLQDQYFTDSKKTAKKYAKSNRGTLIEIDVSQRDLLKYFKIEFQNFSKRNKNFELVYRVSGEILFKKKKRWKYKIIFRPTAKSAFRPLRNKVRSAKLKRQQ